MSGQALTLVENVLPICVNSYGVSPCTASGGPNCFNCRSTCQDLPNFNDDPVTQRFAIATDYLPRDIDIIGPLVASVEYSPGIVSLGENLGTRANLKIVYFDQRHSDAGPGLDKYNQSRGYDPYYQGTLWGRFRERHPSVRGYAVTWINGKVGQALAAMEARYFFAESFDGLTPDGKFSIIGKDALKFLDGDRAQAPVLSNGFLVADIDADDGEATLSPSGIGDDEYDTSGWGNVGGNEIVYYSRDPYTKLLLEFNGSDGATVTADVKVANPHAVTFVGSAQLDTAQFKFGTASLLLGSAGNYISLADSDDWFLGTGNFTIDIHCRFTTVPSGAPNGTEDAFLFRQHVDANNRLSVGFDGTSIFFVHGDGGVGKAAYTATHGMSNATWHHWRFVRSGTSFFIFRDGVALSLTTVTAISTNSLGNIAAVLQIGGQSVAGPDWVDNFRWRKGIADTTSGFTPPAAEYELTGSGDVIRITRGQRGSVASDHKAQDRVQKCLVFDSVSPDVILSTLINDYTDTPSGYVPDSEWATEIATNLNRNFSALIAEPTAVSKLAGEIVQQGPLAMWDDNVAQKLRLQVLRGIPTSAALYDESNVMMGTFSVVDQPEKRVSQVWVYYGQRDPTKRVDDPDNYRSCRKVPEDISDAETNFGAPAIHKIFARWIPALGSSIADTLGAKILSRFSTAPRKLSFEVFRDDVTTLPALGGGYRFEWWNLQEADGSRQNLPIQVTRLLPGPASIKVDAEEMLFVAPDDDLTNRQIVIDSNINNVNLQEVHDALFPPLEMGQTVTCTIAEGVLVGSVNTSLPAFDVGTWSGSPTLNIIVLGRVQGKGGNGGNYGLDGQAGGPALFTREAINLTDASGALWGGGGGGAGGRSPASVSSMGGGGGRGQLPGLGGAGFDPSQNGAAGTTEAAGNAVSAAAGNGGDAGLAGGNGSFGHTGGDAGLAIDGISFVTTVGSPGDRRGGTDN